MIDGWNLPESAEYNGSENFWSLIAPRSCRHHQRDKIFIISPWCWRKQKEKSEYLSVPSRKMTYVGTRWLHLSDYTRDLERSCRCGWRKYVRTYSDWRMVQTWEYDITCHKREAQIASDDTEQETEDYHKIILGRGEHRMKIGNFRLINTWEKIYIFSFLYIFLTSLMFHVRCDHDFQPLIWCQIRRFQLLVCDRWCHISSVEPPLYCGTLVCISIIYNDWILQYFLRDRANEIIR